MAAAQDTHCVHGHPLDMANLYRAPNGRRFCRICNGLASKRKRAKQRKPTTPKPLPVTIATLAETDWAYLAGLIDGEGTVGVYHRDRKHSGQRQLTPSASYRVRLNIVNTHQPVIRWLHAQFGGSVHIKTSPNERTKDGWVWGATRTDVVQAILRRCLPYFRIKQEQARIALQFPGYLRTNQYTRDTVESVALKQWLFKETVRLNRRGPSNAVGTTRRSAQDP